MYGKGPVSTSLNKDVRSGRALHGCLPVLQWGGTQCDVIRLCCATGQRSMASYHEGGSRPIPGPAVPESLCASVLCPWGPLLPSPCLLIGSTVLVNVSHSPTQPRSLASPAPPQPHVLLVCRPQRQRGRPPVRPRRRRRRGRGGRGQPCAHSSRPPWALQRPQVRHQQQGGSRVYASSTGPGAVQTFGDLGSL